MTNFLVWFLPWVLSASSIYASWQVGNKTPWIFKFKIVNQVVWLVWVLLSRNWGLLPTTVMFTIMYIRNDKQWSSDAKATKENVESVQSEMEGVCGLPVV